MKIKEGKIYRYFIYDIANEVYLDKLEKVMGKRPVESQLEYTRLAPKYVKYAQAPYLLQLGKKTVTIKEKKHEFKVTAKLYDFGALSIRFSYTYSGELEGLIDFPSDEFDKELQKSALKYKERIMKDIRDILVKPLEKGFAEDYIIYYVKQFDRRVAVSDLLRKKSKTIAKIIRGEKEELAMSEIKNTLRRPVSYFNDDLVLIDWNGSFIYDPREAVDTLQVLEYANIQLLEVRAYDAFLDNQIDDAYDRMAEARSYGWYRFIWPLEPFSKTMNTLEETRLEVIDTIEKVENRLRLVGDPYLARIYREASYKLHITEWKSGLDEKLETIRGMYDTLLHRIQTERSIILEILIILLIASEIILYFVLGY